MIYVGSLLYGLVFLCLGALPPRWSLIRRKKMFRDRVGQILCFTIAGFFILGSLYKLTASVLLVAAILIGVVALFFALNRSKSK